MFRLWILALLIAATLLGYGDIEDAFAEVQEALVSSFTAQGYPLAPMEEGKFNVKVVPAYWTFSGKSSAINTDLKDKLSGGGFAFSGTYALSAHWGITGLATYFTGSGTGPMNPHLPNAGRFIPGTTQTWGGPRCGGCPQPPPTPDTSQNITGAGGSLGITYDPFSDPEGFRLPMYLGVGFYNIQTDQLAGNFLAQYALVEPTLNPSQVANLPTRQRVRDSLQFITMNAGIAPQFNTGPFRWTPFAMVTVGPVSHSTENQQTNLTTGQTTTANSSRTNTAGIYTGGLGIQYRPWNLGFTYVPGFISRGASLYSLTWSKTF